MAPPSFTANKSTRRAPFKKSWWALTISGWPVYTYIGDKKPLAWTGQGVGGTWWVIAPDGKKNLTCVPTATPKAVPPPADTAAPTANPTEGGGGGNGY